jgi:hypothetical protein
MLLLPGAATAHEIPSRVAVSAFVKPTAGTLEVLVRAPLGAMRDVDIPLRGPGYLDIGSAQPALHHAAELWLAGELRIFEDGRPLGAGHIAGVRVSLPSNRSFTDFASARAHVFSAPLPGDTELYWEQGLLDVLIEYPIRSADAEFSMDPRLAWLGERTVTTLLFLPPGGPERLLRYEGNPGHVVLDPSWNHAAGQFFRLGFRHVLGGLDHLLFVFCLVIPFRRLKPLVMLVTAFTVAHSITLAAVALGMTPGGGWFPPLVETAIAATILYMALENLLHPRLDRRWRLAFGFGLIHGFGFAFALADSLQFAGTHVLWSLAAFNIGIELGQLLVVGGAMLLLTGVFRLGVAERFGAIVASVLIAHTAWHWMTARGAEMLAYPFIWPVLDAAWWLGFMRWATLALIAVGVLWLVNMVYRRWAVTEGDSGRL